MELEQAYYGRGEVNAAYRDHPDTIFDHPVVSLDAEEAMAVASALVELKSADVLSDGNLAAYRPDHAGRRSNGWRCGLSVAVPWAGA
jgi:hypothetical protein